MHFHLVTHLLIDVNQFNAQCKLKIYKNITQTAGDFNIYKSVV